MKPILFLLALFCLAPMLAGCGGASAGSPSSGTQAGLGTLVVSLRNADGSAVADGDAIVDIGQFVGVSRNSQVIFTNLTPGRYLVRARSQAIGLPGGEQTVQIQADRTVRITLLI